MQTVNSPKPSEDVNLLSLHKKRIKVSDIIWRILIYISIIITVGIFAIIILYIIINGINYISLDFFTKAPNDSLEGILPIIINTLYVEVVTLLIAVPIGIGSAIYLTQYVKQGKFVKIIRFCTETLAGIPSILFGLFGYTVFCIMFGLGSSIIAGCLTMVICVLPNIVRTTEETLLTVPKSYKDGALALGAGKFRVIMGIVLPCAMPGILTSIILAVGRIMGESAAFLLTIGTGTKMPKNLFDHIFASGRTLTLHLYYMSGNSSTKDSMNICFGVATILLIMVFILNCLAKLAAKGFRK